MYISVALRVSSVLLAGVGGLFFPPTPPAEDHHSLDATHLLVYVRTRGTFISLYLDAPGFSVGGTSFTHSSHFTAVAVLQVWDQQHQQHLNVLERQVPSSPQTYATRYSENWGPTTCLRNFRF